MAWLRKKLFALPFSTLFLLKPKKLKLTSKVSLNLSFKNVLRLKQKATLFPDSDIYTQY